MSGGRRGAAVPVFYPEWSCLFAAVFLHDDTAISGAQLFCQKPLEKPAGRADRRLYRTDQQPERCNEHAAAFKAPDGYRGRSCRLYHYVITGDPCRATDLYQLTGTDLFLPDPGRQKWQKIQNV